MRLRLFLVLLGAYSLLSCGSDELVNVDPEVAPGPSSPTLLAPQASGAFAAGTV